MMRLASFSFIEDVTCCAVDRTALLIILHAFCSSWSRCRLKTRAVVLRLHIKASRVAAFVSPAVPAPVMWCSNSLPDDKHQHCSWYLPRDFRSWDFQWQSLYKSHAKIHAKGLQPHMLAQCLSQLLFINQDLFSNSPGQRNCSEDSTLCLQKQSQVLVHAGASSNPGVMQQSWALQF